MRNERNPCRLYAFASFTYFKIPASRSSATTITATETIANLRLFFISKLYQIYADYAIFFYKITDRMSPPAVAAHILPVSYAARLRYCRNYAVKHRNAQPWTAGQGVMRHGRRIKAGFVKHRKTVSIISTVSKPLRYSLTGSMCATTADGDLRYLLFAKTQVLYCGFGI